MEPIAYTIEDAAKVVGIGRTKLYEAIKKGELPYKKLGRRTLILAADLRGWLDGLPSVR
jgi:excisionase family DNA binding protein